MAPTKYSLTRIKKGALVKRNFKSKASFKAKKFKLRLRRKGKMPLTKMIGKPRHFTQLMWDQTQNVAVTMTDSYYLGYYPMNVAPNDNGASDVPGSGAILYNGLPLYAQYYNTARVHASKISLQISGAVAPTDLPIQCCLVAVPVVVDNTTNINSQMSELQDLSWDQLASYNGAVRVPIQQGGAGKIAKLSKFCKTASMFNKKTIRDYQLASMTLRTTLGHTDGWRNPIDYWYWFLNIYNPNDGTRYVTVNAKIKSYVEFYNNNMIVEQTLT